MSLTFTGERFLTDCQGEIVYEHWHRYFLACEQARGKRVLDVASGEGYGSHLLASVAETVVGVDISAEAVAHASVKYGKENLQYIAASCTEIPLPDASFDYIVSFETIEHIDEAAQTAFLREVNRLLKPDGVFLISSPNRPEYSEKKGYQNEFHVKELDKEELHLQLSAYWPELIWAGQRLGFYSVIWNIDSAPQLARAYPAAGAALFPEPMYFMVYCAKSAAALAEVRSSITLISDSSNEVYGAWARTYSQNVQLHERNQQLEREIAALTVQMRSEPASTESTAPTPLASVIAPEPWLVRLAKRLAG